MMKTPEGMMAMQVAKKARGGSSSLSQSASAMDVDEGVTMIHG